MINEVDQDETRVKVWFMAKEMMVKKHLMRVHEG